MRSNEEIQAEIALLKDMQPFIRDTQMSPNNTKQFAAQLEVLEQRLSEEHIERKFWCDESAEEFREGDNDVWADALTARMWMQGTEEQPPSHKDNWGALAYENGWLPKPHTMGGERT